MPRPVAVAITIMLPVALLPILVTAPAMALLMPRPLLSLPGGCLISPLASWLALLARRRSAGLTAAVVMRPVPALAIRTAVMTSFFAFWALEFRLWSPKSPDFFKFRFSACGRSTIGCFRRLDARRQLCGGFCLRTCTVFNHCKR